jgi:hypothetical protein
MISRCAALIEIGCGLLVALCLPSRAAVVAGIGQNFTASTLGVDSFALPPDSDGAVGPNHFAELINGRFSVFTKTNITRVQTITDLTFWSRAGVTPPSGWDISDPRIIYDAASQRWFASEVDFDPTGTVNVNSFLLAISATSDPTGAWRGVTIPTDPGGNNFGDFPTLGLDVQGVYLSANLFDPAGNDVAASLVSIPKGDLTAPSPSTQRSTWFGELNYSARGEVLQPAVCVDGSSTGRVLAVGNVGVDFLTHTTLVGSAILNPFSNPATLGNPAIIAVPAYEVPLDPMQPDRSSNLSDGDASITALVYGVGGVLYAVHSTEMNNLAAIRWYRLKAADFGLLESGTISDPVLDLFYPSIAANSNGTVVIGFNGCSISNFVSAYAVVGETRNNVTTFGSRLLLKSGVASYQDGFSESRWGDYSATSVDPADPTRFWTIQMFPSSSSRWSTQVTEIRTSQVILSIAASGGNVTLSWPALASGFHLQSNSSISVANTWSPVTKPPATNGNFLTVSFPSTNSQQFFRLQGTP